jgi:hypothetical protein
VKKGVQRAMYCRCGRERILAHGMCATCYTLRRQDEEYFGGLREAVLERDGYRCRVGDACAAATARKQAAASLRYDVQLFASCRFPSPSETTLA